MRRVLVAFFASGMSGLILELAWVRQLGRLLGTTTQAAAVVTAVFVFGLGLGGFLAGPIVDRLHAKKPERVVVLYAALEAFVAAWALMLAFALPALAQTPFPPTTYAPLVDEPGWQAVSAASRLLEAAVASALLLPPSLAMGATLVVLVRAVVRAGPRAGVDAAWLYGANTAGASIGAFLVDIVLVPAAGLRGAQACAVALNLLAAFLALRAQPKPSPAQPVPSSSSSSSRVATRLVAAVFLAGAVGMALEIVWFRFLGSVLGAHREVLSIVLVVMLVGMWIGTALFGAAAAKSKKPLAAFAVALGLVVVATVAGLSWPDPGLGGVARRLVVTVVVAGPASLCLGVAFPLANAALQERDDAVGRRAALLALANTAGGLVGSLAAGFVLIPVLGMQHAVVFVLVAAVVAHALVASLSFRSAPRVVAACAVAAVVAIGAFAALPKHALLDRIYARVLAKGRVLAYGEDVDGSIAVAERVVDDEPRRILYVDGALMSGTLLGPQRYMRLMAHLPLLQLDAPQSALVICFGVGNTAHALSLHPLERIDVVDLSRQILEHAHDFAKDNHDVLRDPRVHVTVDDGRHFLKSVPDATYDLVTLEPPPINQAGVGALYAEEFYALARAKLKDGGFVTQWLPAYQVTSTAASSMVKAFVDVFPNAVLIHGWDQHFILVGRNSPNATFDPTAVARVLAARPDVAADLKRFELDDVEALAATFAADAKTLEHATDDDAPASDDWPVGETLVGAGALLDAALFDVTGIDRWCPTCAHAAFADKLQRDLDAQQRTYDTPSFRQAL